MMGFADQFVIKRNSPPKLGGVAASGKRADGVVPKPHVAGVRHRNHPASLRSAPLLT